MLIVIILQIIKSFLYLHRNIIAYSSYLPFLFYIRPISPSCFIFVRKSTLVLYSSGILFWPKFFIPQIIKKMLLLSGQYYSNIIVQILHYIKFCFSLVLHLILNIESCQGEGFHCIVTFHLKYKYYISRRISLAAVIMEEYITRASALPILSSALPRTI